MTTIEVNDTLKVEIERGADPHIAIERVDGGRVRIETTELRALIAALAESAGILASWAVRE